MSAPRPWNNFGSLSHIVPAPVKNLNFLLKDDAPSDSFNAVGTVYSDLNGDGAFNLADATVPGASVYWDKNRNGVHDSGELVVTTDVDGKYILPIDLTTITPTPTGNATYQIGVIKPASDWTFTDPGADGVETVFAGPGSADQIVNFFVQPPGSQNNNGNGPGAIQGLLYSDLNNNHVQDLGEPGVQGFRVFLDLNQNGTWDSATEASVVSGSNGAYFFPTVTPGLYRVDVVVPNEGLPNAAWTITSPTVGYRDVQLLPGATITGATFGLKNLAGSDWGDLPDSFHTTSAANGPSHKVQPGFQLGATIDGEVNGQPGAGATNDSSDDGVLVVSNGGILKTGVNTIRVTVFGVGGLLTGWMDFNNDGHFDEAERLNWSLNGNNLGGAADLNPGTYDLQVTIPANAVDHRPIASRFRWGEVGLSFDGPAQIGEVEDYYFGLNFLPGDFNVDGTVDQADYNLWRKQMGQNVTPYAGADGNGDGLVNQLDFEIWRAHFGQSLPAAGAGAGLIAEETSSPSSTASGSLLVVSSGDSGASTTPSYGILSSSGHSQAVAVVASSSGGVSSPATATTSDSTVASGVGSSASSTSTSPLLAPFVADASATSSTVSATGRTSASSSETSSADLLLLDQTWADLDHTSFDHDDDSLYSDESHEVVCTNDLALAAVLRDDDNLWNSI